MGAPESPAGKLPARRGTVSTTTDKAFYGKWSKPVKELFSVIAVHSRDAHQILKLMNPGTQLWMMKEGHRKNPNGIGVFHENKRLGYLPKSICDKIRPLMEAGKFVICVKTKDGPATVKFVIGDDNATGTEKAV